MAPDAARFTLGQRVGVAWLWWTCSQCAYCRRGSENLCPRARFTGYHENGGYAQYATVHEDFAYALPAELDPIHAAPLLCAGIIGFRAMRRAQSAPGLPDGHLRLRIISAHRDPGGEILELLDLRDDARLASSGAGAPVRCHVGRRGHGSSTPTTRQRDPLRSGWRVGSACLGGPGHGRHAGHRRNLLV